MTNFANLIPARRRYAKAVRTRLRVWCGALVAGAIALTLGCIVLRVRVPATAATEKEIAKIEAQINEVNAALKELSKNSAQTEKTRTTVELFLDQPDWSLLLRMLASKTGDRAVLRDIRLKPMRDSAPVTVATVVNQTNKAGPVERLPDKYTLELRGYCKSPAEVSLFVSELEKLGLFQKVTLLRTSREAFLGGVASQFEVECTMSGAGGVK